jgi:hypothetical protein
VADKIIFYFHRKVAKTVIVCNRNFYCQLKICWLKMAFVVRSGRLVGPLRNYLRPVAFGNRCISTSKKNDETAVVTEKIPSHKTTIEPHDIDAVAASAKKVH